MAHPALEQLERQLARKGEDVVYTSYDCDGNETTASMRAIARGYRSEQATAGITEDDISIVVSPRPFAAAGISPTKGELLLVGGRQRFVTAVGVIRIGDEPVRIDLKVKG